jgi:hypothetical protein
MKQTPLPVLNTGREIRIISFIDHPDVIKKIIQYPLSIGRTSPDRHAPIKEITAPSYTQLI